MELIRLTIDSAVLLYILNTQLNPQKIAPGNGTQMQTVEMAGWFSGFMTGGAYRVRRWEWEGLD